MIDGKDGATIREITTDMVKKILVDFYDSLDSFHNYYDVDVVIRKVDAGNGKDVPLDDFIKLWAVAYDFCQYFNLYDKNENVGKVVDDFIENNKYYYLEMLKNEEYQTFMRNIMDILSIGY